MVLQILSFLSLFTIFPAISMEARSKVPLLTDLCCKKINDYLLSSQQVDLLPWFDPSAISEHAKELIKKTLIIYNAAIFWDKFSPKIESLVDNQKILTISNDGNIALTVSDNGSVNVIDTLSHRYVGQLDIGLQEIAEIDSALISLDNTFVVTKINNIAKIWDALTGNLKFKISKHNDKISTILISIDSSIIITFSQKDGQICIWCASTQKLIHQIFVNRQDIKLALSSNNEFLIVYNTQKLSVLSLFTGTIVHKFKFKTNKLLNTLKISHNNEFLALACTNNKIYLVDPQTGYFFKKYTLDAPISKIDISFDNTYMIVKTRNALYLLDVQSDSKTELSSSHNYIIKNILISKDSNLIISTIKNLSKSDIVMLPSGDIDAVIVQVPDESISIKIWDAHTSQLIKQFNFSDSNSVKEIAISSDNCSVIANLHNSILILNLTHEINQLLSSEVPIEKILAIIIDACQINYGRLMSQLTNSSKECLENELSLKTLIAKSFQESCLVS